MVVLKFGFWLKHLKIDLYLPVAKNTVFLIVYIANIFYLKGNSQLTKVLKKIKKKSIHLP